MRIKTLLIICSVIIYLLVFKDFFTDSPLAWGDSPYFYTENLKELFNKPLLWNDRTDNFGTPLNNILWLFFPTFLFGLIHQIFGLNHEIIVRLIFYFPATILGFIGTYLFLQKFAKSSAANLMGSFLYVFNTYFLVLIDGGQIGVSLAYGLFPLVIWSLLNFLERPKLKNFYIVLIGLFAIINTDLRVTILALFFTGLLVLFKFKKSKIDSYASLLSLILLISLFMLNQFWIIPFLSGAESLQVISSGSNLISLTNTLSLFQPHFPLNEFGKTISTPFYFIGVIFILFYAVIKKPNKLKLLFASLFLFFAFLAKGGNGPFGEVYIFLINNFPFGVSFRDSSKFFIPLILCASVLLSFFVTRIEKELKSQQTGLVIIATFIYLGFLIYPAILGQLTGTLGMPKNNDNFKKIYTNLNQEDGFLRTLWFPEKPPLGFGSHQRSAISANLLYRELPFATQIQGDYDKFYFLNDPLFPDWLSLLGIKYLFFPENERKKTWTDIEIRERNQFIEFVNNLEGFKKSNWGLDFPALEIEEKTQDRFIVQDKVVLILGEGNSYNKLKTSIGYNLSKNGLLYLEDGKFNVSHLLTLPDQSAVLVLNNRSKEDLVFNFLSPHFLKDLQFKSNQWGNYKSESYLEWKAEIHKNSINTTDLGYNSGLIFSAQPNEISEVKLNIPKTGEYLIGLRHISSTSSGQLKVSIKNQEEQLLPNTSGQFIWSVTNPIQLKEGEQILRLHNSYGFQGVNIVSYFLKEDYQKAEQKAENLITKFGLYNLDNINDQLELKSILDQTTVTNIKYHQKNTTEYQIFLPESDLFWLIFSEHYHPEWELNIDTASQSYPLYSMLNGFYIQNPHRPEGINLKFEMQQKADLGLKLSIISLIILFLPLIVILIRRWYPQRKNI